jgi:hypothetical protein
MSLFRKLCAGVLASSLFFSCGPVDEGADGVESRADELDVLSQDPNAITQTLSHQEIESLLPLILSGTRVQVDTKGNGPKVATGRIWVKANIPPHKLDQICHGDPECEDRILSREGRWVTTYASSYINPGPTLRAAAQSAGKTLSPVVLNVPVFTVINCKVRINNLHTELGFGTLQPSLSSGALGTSVNFSSASPTIELTRDGFFAICPDINLSNMVLSGSLSGFRAQPDQSGVTYDAASVAFNFGMSVNNFPDLARIKNAIKSNVESGLRNGLLHDEAKKAVSRGILEALNQKMKLQNPAWRGVDKVISASASGALMTVRFTQRP